MNVTLATLFLAATAAYHLPPGLLSALCWTESRGKVNAVHHDDGTEDSLGVCQVKPKTARYMGFTGTEKELMIPRINIKYSARYLKYQLIRYHGNVVKAIAAYNAGRYRPGPDGLPLNKGYVLHVLRAHREGR